MSQEVIILKGLPASGKSTFAKKLVDDNPGKYKRINKDDLRAMLDNSKWSKANEKLVLHFRNEMIIKALQENYSVIVDDTNLNAKHEREITDMVHLYNQNFKHARSKMVDIVVNDSFLSVHIEDCIARDLKRPVSVGEKVIRKMAKEAGLTDRVVGERYYVPGLHECLICDLDGTLALLNGRNPYDPKTVLEDEINKPVAQIVRILDELHDVFFFSGRKEKYRLETQQWLFFHGFKNYKLFMRADDDMRKDSIVKREMFEANIRNKFNVFLVLDDRNQVVDLWRNDLGLTCFQVAPGDF